MVGAIEDEQAGARGGGLVVRDAAIGGLGLADGTIVSGAGHVKDGDLDRGELAGWPSRRRRDGSAHGDGGLDAAIDEGLCGAGLLADNGEGGPCAEGMTGHADGFFIDKSLERGGGVAIEGEDAGDGESDIERAVEGVRGSATERLSWARPSKPASRQTASSLPRCWKWTEM